MHHIVVPLDARHRDAWVARATPAAAAGLDPARHCARPHITLLDHGLDSRELGDAAAWRHHPSWKIAVDRLAITGAWDHRGESALDLPLGR